MRFCRWQCSNRAWQFSTKPIPASTSTHLKAVAAGVNALRSPDRAIVLVTHYQRLLDYVEPDHVHVLSGGRIVKSGDKSLAVTLEAERLRLGSGSSDGA